MSYAKIAEVTKTIPSEQELSKLNEVLASLKLVTKSEYEVVGSSERADKQGVLWQIVTVSCRLTIIDVESDEEIVNIALGTGIDSGDRAVLKAQVMARREAWKAALNIPEEDKPDVVTAEIIVETPESKLIAHIRALWKWTPEQLVTWYTERFHKPLEQLNITELTVMKNELENYGR